MKCAALRNPERLLLLPNFSEVAVCQPPAIDPENHNGSARAILLWGEPKRL